METLYLYGGIALLIFLFWRLYQWFTAPARAILHIFADLCYTGTPGLEGNAVSDANYRAYSERAEEERRHRNERGRQMRTSLIKAKDACSAALLTGMADLEKKRADGTISGRDHRIHVSILQERHDEDWRTAVTTAKRLYGSGPVSHTLLDLGLHY